MIWNLNVPLKIKNFLWRICNIYVATNRNLCKRRVKVLALCHICESRDESIEHTLLLCEWVRAVWSGIGISWKIAKELIRSVDIWFENAISNDGMCRD